MKIATVGTGMITEWLNTAFQQNGLEPYAVYSRKQETGPERSGPVLVSYYFLKSLWILRSRKCGYPFLPRRLPSGQLPGCLRFTQAPYPFGA